MRFLVIFLILQFILTPLISLAESEADLKNQIESKNNELKQIEEQIKVTQENLQNTNQKSKTIESEVNRLNKNINQLKLGIRSAELSLSKLSLEIGSLNNEVSDIETEINVKNESVAKVLKEIQDSEEESPIITFLRGNTLADSFESVQVLIDINNRLILESNILKELRDSLKNKKYNREVKKEDVTTENYNLKNRKEIVEDQSEERKKLLSLTKKEAQSYEKEISDLEERQEEIANEIESIEKKLTADLDKNTLPIDASLALPIKVSNPRKIFTQDYGYTSFSAKAYKSGFHNGIDFGLPVGTPVFAPQDGIIASTGNQDNYCYRGAYGKFIAIKHINNLTTMYAHLSKVVVSPQQSIKQGDLIGYSGHTGYSTGPHLHFTVYSSPTFYIGSSTYCGPMPFGAHLDPLDYLEKF